jgi:HEAT repeat protein
MQIEAPTVDALIAKIKDRSDLVRAEGWASAGKVGSAAVKPLAAVMTSGDVDREVARAARKALWQIVHYAGRPGGEKECEAVLPELHALLADAWPEALRREALWMLSEIGGAESILPISACLKSSELLEDARCALTRIPGEESLSALKEALMTVPEKYRNNIVQSLRARGVELSTEQYPSQKLVPKKTEEKVEEKGEKGEGKGEK